MQGSSNSIFNTHVYVTSPLIFRNQEVFWHNIAKKDMTDSVTNPLWLLMERKETKPGTNGGFQQSYDNNPPSYGQYYRNGHDCGRRRGLRNTVLAYIYRNEEVFGNTKKVKEADNEILKVNQRQVLWYGILGVNLQTPIPYLTTSLRHQRAEWPRPSGYTRHSVWRPDRVYRSGYMNVDGFLGAEVHLQQ